MSVEEEAAIVSGEAAEPVPQESENTNPKEEAEASPESVEGGQPTEEAESEEHRPKAQERIQELANKNKELAQKIEGLERAFRQKQELEAVPFLNLDMQAINAHIAQASDQIEELKLEGKHFEAQKLQRDLDKLIDEVDANEAKRKEWSQRQGQQQTQAQQFEAAVKALDDAAEFYREKKGIPQEVWDKGADQWYAMRQADPILDRQYTEIWMRQGEIAAIQFAEEHVQKAQSAETKKLEEAKKKADAGKVNIAATGAPPAGIKSWDQLVGLGSKQVEAYKKNNPKHYQQLLDAHLK